MKKHIIFFLIGLLLLGIGCGYFTFEILEFDYRNEVDPNIKIASQTKVYELGPTEKYEVEVNNGILKVVLDNSLENRMEITTSYPRDYIGLHTQEEQEKHHQIELTYNFYDTTKVHDVHKAVEEILENISKKRFYNYEKTFSPVVEVKIKEENLKYVELNEDRAWHD